MERWVQKLADANTTSFGHASKMSFIERAKLESATPQTLATLQKWKHGKPKTKWENEHKEKPQNREDDWEDFKQSISSVFRLASYLGADTDFRCVLTF